MQAYEFGFVSTMDTDSWADPKNCGRAPRYSGYDGTFVSSQSSRVGSHSTNGWSD